MENNRKNAIILACISFAASLLVSVYITTFQYSPVVVLYPSISLLGIIGILLRKKELLIASALISLALMILGIMTVGGLFFISSLPLLISIFVYPGDFEKVEVNEKAKRTARIMMIASLFAAIAAGIAELSWLYIKFSAGKWILSDIEFIFLILLLAVLPVLGLTGISRGNRDFLSTSAAISVVLAVFMGIFLRRPMFLVSALLLIFSAFEYQGGIIRATRKENIDAKIKKIAFVLAGISLLAAIITTLYIEHVLIVDGCYSFQTTTDRVRICEDFRPGYVLPVILSVIGAAGILRNNKTMINTSAALSFVRLVTSLSAIDTLFVPSFAALIISALVYQKGIRKGDIHIQIEIGEDHRQYHVLLLLFAVLIIWIFSVYLFIHPNTSGGSGSYFPPDHP